MVHSNCGSRYRNSEAVAQLVQLDLAKWRCQAGVAFERWGKLWTYVAALLVVGMLTLAFRSKAISDARSHDSCDQPLVTLLRSLHVIIAVNAFQKEIARYILLCSGIGEVWGGAAPGCFLPAAGCFCRLHKIFKTGQSTNLSNN